MADYVAAHDQKLATLADVLKEKPAQFILLYENEESIGAVIFAHPGFLAACIPILIDRLDGIGNISLD